MDLRSKAVLLVGVCAALSLLLSGCGNDDKTTPTTTTTTTTLHPRTQPLSADEAVKYLNELYMGFNPTDEKSSLGVTISMAANNDQFFGNFFCHSWTSNPLGQTGCYAGFADCRISASLYNHRMMLVNGTNITLPAMDRDYGFVFNQSQVEQAWGKCYYLWDGATGRRYNRGCGVGAPGDSCQPGCAYDNICSSGKTCTASDAEVVGAKCDLAGGPVKVPDTHAGYQQCYLPGPALDYHEQSGYAPGETKWLRTMVEERVKRNSGHDEEGPNIQKWNEVVVDGLLFLPDLWYDPALAIPAIVYSKKLLPQSKAIAEKMSKQFAEQAKASPIPVIMMDDVDYQPGGPFSHPADLLADVTIV